MHTVPETKTSNEDFGRLSQPFRRELLAYCYRMLGSVEDAEEVVQDVYLDAWRAYDGFEGRSSLLTWLYRIATRACFKALDKSRRRPLPADLAAPETNPEARLVERAPEVPWLQPIPDLLFTAAPEELFFRAWVQNLLERRVSRRAQQQGKHRNGAAGLDGRS